jgi:hypothetical protein
LSLLNLVTKKKKTHGDYRAGVAALNRKFERHKDRDREREQEKEKETETETEKQAEKQDARDVGGKKAGEKKEKIRDTRDSNAHSPSSSREAPLVRAGVEEGGGEEGGGGRDEEEWGGGV